MKVLGHIFLVGVFLFALTSIVDAAEIGQMAAERAKEAGEIANAYSVEQIKATTKWVYILGAVLFVLLLILIGQLSYLTGLRPPFSGWKANKIHPTLILIAGISGLISFVISLFVVWDRMILPSASEHAPTIDKLMLITFILTVIVFFATQGMLTLFSYLYRGKEGRKALYYPVNDKLEIIWTVVPATVLTVLILYSLIYVWDDVMIDAQEKPAYEVEIVGEQFRWTIRYPGADGKLGRYNYKLIKGNNSVGLDFNDPHAKDDIVISVPELRLPKGQLVRVHVRSKDVLHGFYAPHFRAHIYAVPGTPTSFTFKPTVTTEEMRKQTGNENFNYEIECSQLCGGGHYSMKGTIIVMEPEAFEQWLKEQKPLYSTLQSEKENLAHRQQKETSKAS